MATNNQTNRQIKYYKQFFLHNSFEYLMKGLLYQYFGHDYFPDFKTKNISTYTKAVQDFIQLSTAENVGQTFFNAPPSLLIDPITSNMELNERANGMGMYRFEEISPQYIAESGVFPPLVKTDNILLFQMSDGIKFEFNVLINVESVYQFLDHERALLRWTRGLNRPFVKSELPIELFAIIPDEVSEYMYENYYNGQTEQLNLPALLNSVGNERCKIELIKTLNKEMLICKYVIHPMLTMTSLTNSNEIYGNDQLEKFALSASFTCECELPSHMILYTDWKLEKVDTNVGIGNIVSTFGVEWEAPTNLFFPCRDYGTPLPPNLIAKDLFTHVFDADTVIGHTIELPYVLQEETLKYTRLNMSEGFLTYGKGTDGGGFYIEPTARNIIELNVPFKKDAILEIITYETN